MEFVSPASGDGGCRGGGGGGGGGSGSRGRWEGLGGPVLVDRPDLNGIDPTLEMCCRREEESIRRANAVKRTLQRHDVVSERERRRRNLVSIPGAFASAAGCRCCYDPNTDGCGDGEYRALRELREERRKEEDQWRKQQTGKQLHDDASRKEEEEETVEVVGHTEAKNNNDKDEEDEEEDEFDYLLDEDLPGQREELKALEEMRRAELEMSLLRREIAVEHGYGVLRQMHPSRVLRAAGLSSYSGSGGNGRLSSRSPPAAAVVLHLVDPESMASAMLDLYLERLATETARGTKFLRSAGRSTLLMNGELSAKAFPRQLHPNRDMPAIVAIREGVVVNTCPRLQGLVDMRDGEVVPDAVYEWLDRSGVLLEQPPLMEHICGIRPEEEALMDCLLAGQETKKPTEEEEFARFDCGVEGCNKVFPHEHVGIHNDQQEGRIVPEKQVLDNNEELK